MKVVADKLIILLSVVEVVPEILLDYQHLVEEVPEEALVVRGGEAPVIRVPPADGLGVDGVVDRADPDGDPDGADPDGAADRTERADASDAREADEGPGGYALPSGAAPPARFAPSPPPRQPSGRSFNRTFSG